MYIGRAGESAEGGQHAIAGAEPEAGQAQGLALPREAHRRMDVARERIAAAHRAGLVVEHEGAQRLARVDAAHAPAFRRVARARIVVAAHQRELDGGTRRAPGTEALEGSRGAAFGAVQEVAEEDHAPRAGARERTLEPVDVLARRSRRHRDAELAEARRLAEMEVGDEERFPARPVRGFLGEEDQLFAGYFALNHRAGPIGCPTPRGRHLPCRIPTASGARGRRASRW